MSDARPEASLPAGVEVLHGRRHADQRGWLKVALSASQLPADTPFGELYFVHALATGDRRGDHSHARMDEWFTVVHGRATLELWLPGGDTLHTVELGAQDDVTVRVPAGVAHCLVNAGPGPMTAAAWASAEHDPHDVLDAEPPPGGAENALT